MPRRLLFPALGALVYFALDSIHVRVGIWRPSVAPVLPWWFIFIYFGGILGCAGLLRRLEARVGVPVRLSLALDGVLLAVLLTIHILLFKTEALLAALCAGLLVVRLGFFRRPGDLLVAATVAGVEAGIELVLSAAGLFAYSHASLGPLPLWHVPFWASLGLCLRGLFFFAGAADAPVLRAAADGPR
jgi:hypothetical protein